jgi:hypothetical protein
MQEDRGSFSLGVADMLALDNDQAASLIESGNSGIGMRSFLNGKGIHKSILLPLPLPRLLR